MLREFLDPLRLCLTITNRIRMSQVDQCQLRFKSCRRGWLSLIKDLRCIKQGFDAGIVPLKSKLQTGVQQIMDSRIELGLKLGLLGGFRDAFFRQLDDLQIAISANGFCLFELSLKFCFFFRS